MNPASDRLTFTDETARDAAAPPWDVLVVDDDPEVHAVTRLALDRCLYAERGVRIVSAHSAAQGRELLSQHPGVALILLDVVMETASAGLDFARHVREQLGNRQVRIVLRTGQPGEAPARDIVARYEIDDYRTKTELTFERLQIIVITALRSFTLLQSLADREAELRRRNEQLERFTELASQDLQEPLRTILGQAQRLRHHLGASPDADAADALNSIAEAGRHSHATVDSLLEYARLGRDLGAARRVALDGIVRDALSRLRPVIEGRGASISASPLPTVLGHPELLELLFSHLIENAVKYQRGDAPKVRIAARASDAHWEIRIVDQGIGIDARHLELVFEPFQRLHPPDRYAGAGLGLAIARRAAELDGGTLHAESEPGVGTQMVLRLPRRTTPP